jgi:hypothetical protein
MRGKRNAAKPDTERKKHRVELSLTDAERAYLDTIADTPQAAVRKLIANNAGAIASNNIINEMSASQH